MSIIKLSEANCRHCMRCVRICPTNAMTYINNQPIINEDECVLCGKCYAICPHSAKEVSSDMTLINRWLNNGESVILSVAPSFVRLFPSFKHLKAELLKRGFAAVDETARGAKLVSEQYLALMKEGKMDNILSTCCPAAVDYVRKYFPECIKYLAPVVSPMIAHAKILKAEHPDARVVFLTPCIAKKAEIAKKELAGIVDATITMEEMMHFLNTDFYHDVPDYGEDEDPGIARIYPSGGGILKTLPDDTGYKMLHIENINNIANMLEALKNGDLHRYFIEFSACDHSCINGPLITHLNNEEFKAVDIMETSIAQCEPVKLKALDDNLRVGFTSEEVIRKKHSEEEILDVLYRMGKTNSTLELNCGACGYETCRLKAMAVLDGKADINLCLPKALKDATSYANLIIANTPNGIIVLDKNFNIEEINPSAKRMLQVEEISVNGLPIDMLLNDKGFLRIVKSVHDVQYYKCNYPKYHLTIDHAIINIKDSKKYIVILMDMTVETVKERQINEIRRQTIAVTDQVIDEQMRTVQEIASLLGETTAKAKVALTNLKRELENE